MTNLIRKDFSSYGKYRYYKKIRKDGFDEYKIVPYTRGVPDLKPQRVKRDLLRMVLRKKLMKIRFLPIFKERLDWTGWYFYKKLYE